MLSVKNLTKIYKIKGKDVKHVVALDRVSIDFPETGMVFLLGKSGSGKSTLLNSIGGLDTFNDGEILIKGKSSKDFKQSDFDAYRNTFIGFIFQEYNILEEFTIGKNLALALELQGKKADNAAVNALLDKVDLSGYYKRKPNQLSGGQKQRVAIARALIKDPEIIMADEPTGALDSNTGKQVMDTLKKLSKEKLVIIVSHDREFAEIYGDRVIELKDGHIISDNTKHEVAADKSASGVSFIDDKIIHIKKGQQLNKEDLVKINQMIIANTNNQDTIISFDEKPNREIKKTAFITDDGNREVFKSTTKEDVTLKNYDPKQFKLIRSKMKIKDAFKMGSSSLKHKPIRLFFTILLSFAAFAMFGLADTMASFNVATSTYESLKMTDTHNLPITAVEINQYGYKSTSGMTKESAATLKARHAEYKFYEVINPGKDYYYSYSTYSLNNAETKDQSNNSYSYGPSIYGMTLSGVLPLDATVAADLNLKLTDGRYPIADDEVVISEHMFNCIKRSYKNIENFSDLSGKTFNGAGLTTNTYVPGHDDGNGNWIPGYYEGAKIVGIVHDDTDISKYTKDADTSTNNASMQNYISYSEMQTVTSYGLVNMCYVSPSRYQSMADGYTMSRELRYYLGDEKPDWSSSLYKNYIYTIEQMQKDYDIWQATKTVTDYWGDHTETLYYNPSKGDEIPADAEDTNQYWTFVTDGLKYIKTGVDINNLQDNQIIITDNFPSYLDDTSDPQALLDGGLKYTIENSQGDVMYEFEVVAITNGYSQVEYDKTYSEWNSGPRTYYSNSDMIIMTSNLYQEMFTGCDYLVTRLKGNSGADYALVKDLVTYNNGGNGYNVQFAASFQIDNFASMIVNMKQVFLYVGIGFAVFASFLLMNFISISINYKKREIGVLRAIGAGKKDVFSIFFSESFVIAVINFVLAAIATVVASFFINRSLYQELGFQITLLTVGIRQIALLIAVSLGVAFISTLLPVYRIARKNPIDSINNR